jgi:hypothetical protein
MSQITNDQATTQSSNKWSEVVGQIIDRLMGKNMSATYDFQQLTIDMPKAEGPDGKHIGSVKWTVNGRIVITTEAHEKDSSMRSGIAHDSG